MAEVTICSVWYSMCACGVCAGVCSVCVCVCVCEVLRKTGDREGGRKGLLADKTLSSTVYIFYIYKTEIKLYVNVSCF